MELNKEQIEFLNRCTLGKWTLNEKTGLVDIEGRFYCYDENLTDFKGVKFGVVTGDFRCFNNSLTSLVGAPKKVGGDFNCTNNKLTSLVGAPQEVGGDFCCYYNKIKIPERILELVIGTMLNKKVNYYVALFLNKEAIDKEINKRKKNLEKIERIFVEIDANLSKDAQKTYSIISRYR
jgi:hypothetical protein